MPITGPSSYVPTTEEFEQHWATANATLGVGNEIVLPDGTDLAGLTAKKDALVAKRADLQAERNVKEVHRGDIELKKEALLNWLVEFNKKVRAFFPKSKWLGALPEVPSITEAQSKITDELDNGNALWQMINADPATASPMILINNYDQATFDADIVALKAAYTAWNGARVTVKVTRGERDTLQAEIKAILLSYRKVLPTFFPKDHTMVQSMPRLTPLPGSTPDAVVATGEWDDTTMQSKITWTESTDPNLLEYEIRYVTGPDYSTEDEAVSGSVLPGGNLEFFTVDGLNGPGTAASYKVYVKLNTGNEKGSNAVSVTQP